MENLSAVILAAGKGTRMKSDLPKVLHEIDGTPLAVYVKNAAKAAGADRICYVVGYQKELVEQTLSAPDVGFAIQDEQLGTGHAVKCAKDFIGESGDVMILCGDTPLVTEETLKRAADFHVENGCTVTVLSTILDDPSGYGHIIRDEKGTFIKSVEHKDATDAEKQVKEVNAGMYIFDAAALSEALDLLNNDNAQGEYYLPDTLEILLGKGYKVDACVIEDSTQIMGVNDPDQLRNAAQILRKREV